MMIVVGTKAIYSYLNTAGATPQAADLRSWLSSTQAAAWKGPKHVTATFPAAVNTTGIDWEFPMPQPTVFATIDFRTNPGTVRVRQVK